MQLSRETIVTQAMSILDEYGLGDLTMRRLARQLDVVPGALYWHLPNKQSLLEALAEEIIAPIFHDPSHDDAHLHPPTWQNAAAEVATELRAAMNSHRDGAEVVVAALPVADLRDRIVQRFSLALESAGLDSDTLEVASQTLVDFTMGSSLNEQAQRQLSQVTDPASFSAAANMTQADRAFDSRLALVLAGVSSVAQLK